MVFTPNKNLEQPARGSNVGVWDTPVNANTSIIDNSFGGVATIPLVNTPVTLSAAQYQCVFLNFTGAISANIAITLPAVGSFYTIQNLTSNTSAFGITMLTTAAGGQTIGIPPGEPCEIFTDGTNVKYRNLGRVGTYWDYAGSSVPAWVSVCTVPPYLNCDGTAFSSATFPILATILGGTTLPDSKGRLRLTLDQSATRVSSSVSGVAGNTLLAGGGDQQTQQHSHTATVTDPGHTHTHNVSTVLVSGAGSFFAASGASASPGSMVINSALTGITVANSTYGGGGSQNMPPVYVGGLTLIRAA